MLNYFIWKGINSMAFDLMCNIPPRVIPQLNSKKITIPGRSGFVNYSDNSFNYISKPIECRILDDSKIDSLIPWLMGTDKVIFSDERDKYYKATINRAVPIEYMIADYRGFSLVFDCQPFKYSVNHKQHKVEIVKSPHTMFGQGNIDSEPIIKVHGSGTIYLTINSKLITLTNVSGHITLNSEIKDAYKDDINANKQMTGDFPILYADKKVNLISYSGNVNKIEIQPNWRWF